MRKHLPEEHYPEDPPGRKPTPARKVLRAGLRILNTDAQWHMRVRFENRAIPRPPLPGARPKKVMVEEQSSVSGLSGYPSGLHADRVERSDKGEDCEIKLVFQL